MAATSDMWTVRYDDGLFVAANPVGDFELAIDTPLELDPSFEGRPFELHGFAVRDLKESAIHEVHLDCDSDPAVARIGMMLPVNSLGSQDHDESGKKYFQEYAYVAIKLALERLCRESPEVLEAQVARGHSVLFSDLFDDNVCFLVLSQKNFASVKFELDRILPSLVALGYVPMNSCRPAELEWIGSPPSGRVVKVKQTSYDIENAELVARLIVLSAVSSRSLVTQFFYLYQVVEYLMENVMRHRLPLVMRDIIDELASGTASTREQFDVLGNEIREKGRLKLLVGPYSDCASDVSEFGAVAQDFLASLNIKASPDIDAIYKTRNFLFHQARNLPSQEYPLLASAVGSFFAFLPSLLYSYRNPSEVGQAEDDSA